MKKSSLWILFTLIIIVVVGAILVGGMPKNNPTPLNNKMLVVGTFYPLAHFAQQVGGDYVQVSTITPAGAEPHDYEPTPQDIVKVYNAKVFIRNGGGVDTWAEKIGPEVPAKGIVVVDMHNSIQLMNAPSGAETPTDPHIWLDPVLAQQEVGLIRDAFIKADPAHADAYRKNADAYIGQLSDLDNAYKTGLASCKIKDIITSHAAFGYLAKRYGLNQISITGLSPDAEPSAQTLANVSRLAKEKHIQYIFFETLVSPKLSETIAKEVGAQTISFNPLEGLTEQEIQSGKTYITEMHSNLDHLKTALGCSQ